MSSQPQSCSLAIGWPRQAWQALQARRAVLGPQPGQAPSPQASPPTLLVYQFSTSACSARLTKAARWPHCRAQAISAMGWSTTGSWSRNVLLVELTAL